MRLCLDLSRTIKRQVHGLGNKSGKSSWQRWSSTNQWTMRVKDFFVFREEDGENKNGHAQSTKCSLQSEVYGSKASYNV